jgi:hypothetical protein
VGCGGGRCRGRCGRFTRNRPSSCTGVLLFEGGVRVAVPSGCHLISLTGRGCVQVTLSVASPRIVIAERFHAGAADLAEPSSRSFSSDMLVVQLGDARIVLGDSADARALALHDAVSVSVTNTRVDMVNASPYGPLMSDAVRSFHGESSHVLLPTSASVVRGVRDVGDGLLDVRLPAVRIVLSSQKYCTLMRILDKVLGELAALSSTASSPAAVQPASSVAAQPPLSDGVPGSDGVASASGEVAVPVLRFE